MALATPAELAVPPIAWPTVGVFLLGCALYCLPPLLTWQQPTLKVRVVLGREGNKRLVGWLLCVRAPSC